MSSVKLILRKDKLLSDNACPILLQVIKDQKKAITTLPVSCQESDWNVKTNLPKNTRLSLICQKKLLSLQEICLSGEDQNWTAREIIDIFTGKASRHLLFFEYSDKVIKTGDRSFSTIRTMRTREKKFREFSSAGLRMSDITHDLLLSYKEHLSGKSAAFKYIQFIRQVYSQAVEYDKFIPLSNPFKRDLFFRKPKTINRNLSIDETRAIFRIKLDHWNRFSGKNFALDFWRLAFLMRGMNAVDLVSIPQDVGEYYSFTRRKLRWRTSEIQKIKIFPAARKIIDKYKDPENEYLLPFLRNGQTLENDFQAYESRKRIMSGNLLKIHNELQIKNNMSTMSPRYTFVNIGKQIGTPFLAIQEMIGHKTLSTTDAYLDAFPQEQIDRYHEKIISKII